MKIQPFFTERYFAQYEFNAPYLLSASDCESMTVDELLQLAGVPRDTLGDLWLGYTETQGAPALRERIAALYREIATDQVIGLSSPEEGIFLTMHALLEPGDEVIVLTPCYDSLLNVVQYLGCQVSRWFMEEQSEGWRLDLDSLQALLTPLTKMVVVNFPHNPTGCLPSREEWQSLVEAVSKAGAWLFSDEMYRGLEYDPSTRLAAGCDLYDRAITLCGLSKTYGLPGLRTGWLALHDQQLRDRILTWKDYTTICASAPSEVLAQIALDSAEVLIQRNQEIVTTNLSLAAAFFDRWSSLLRWNRPQAGSVALAALHQGSAQAFCQRLVEEQGVLLLPSSGLGLGDGHVRFGFGRLSFPQALEQLDLYLVRQGSTAGPVPVSGR